MARQGKNGWRSGHQLDLLEGGERLFPAMADAIDRARTLVHVETYICTFSGAAAQVAEAMVRAARRGVEVRLLVDGVGTGALPAPWAERLSAAGVQHRVFAPLGRLGLLIPSRWRRLHRKLCVVDSHTGFCGGINLIDDRDDLALGPLAVPRLDYAVRVHGPLVQDMQQQMDRLWWRLVAVGMAKQRAFRGAWYALRVAGPGGVAAHPGGERRSRAALLWRDNVRHRHDIERAYLRAIGTARHDIVIANAYFIPGRRLRRALALAVQRGVRVRLLLQGRYESFFQYHAARPVYGWLLQAGVDIHEYAPSALHAKVAVVDKRWATVGSTNLDPLSLLLAREANVVSNDPVFAQHLWARLDHLLRTAGQPVDVANNLSRPWRQRALDRLAFATMRVVLFLTGHRY